MRSHHDPGLSRAQSIYLDTSAVGAYYDDRDERRRDLTREFWRRLPDFSPNISTLVLDELAAVGSIALRNRLLRLVSAFKVLPVTAEAQTLARQYVESDIVVETFYADALHLAVASAHGMDYLVSWNFRHLVNIRTRKLVASVNVNNGFRQLEIIAPPELRWTQ